MNSSFRAGQRAITRPEAEAYRDTGLIPIEGVGRSGASMPELPFSEDTDAYPSKPTTTFYAVTAGSTATSSTRPGCASR